jgi:hypothetical protein
MLRRLRRIPLLMAWLLGVAALVPITTTSATAAVSPDPLAATTTAAEPVPAVEPPDTTTTPAFVDNFALAGGQRDGRVALTTGGGRVWVAQEDVPAVVGRNAATYADSGHFALPVGARPRGIAYYRGEVYVGDAAHDRIVVAQPGGVGERQLVLPTVLLLSEGSGSPDVLASHLEITGLDVAWQEVWVTMAATAGGRVILVLDAVTGTPKAITWQLADYNCGAALQALQGDCTDGLGAGKVLLGACTTYENAYGDVRKNLTLVVHNCSSELQDPVDPDAEAQAAAEQGDAAWDIATVPERGGVISACRFYSRGAMLTATTAPDVRSVSAPVDADMGVPASSKPDITSPPTDCSLAGDGFDAVWGMGWYLQLSESPFDDSAARIDEYRIGTPNPRLQSARSWSTQGAAAHGDVAYQARETRIDWSGDLTTSSWQRGTRCVRFLISDADIFVARGTVGEHYYELARGFVGVELFVDGASTGVSTTAPDASLCLDLSSVASGVHSLELRATVDGGTRTVTQRNAMLRIDHDVPGVTLDPVPSYVAGARSITGSVTDSHSGPGSWRVEIRPAGGNWSLLCALTADSTALGGPACNWGTTRFADGTYEIRAIGRDRVENALGGPNESERHTSTYVDNTAPAVDAGGELRDRSDLAPMYDDEEPSVTVMGTDGGAGITRLSLAVDNVPADEQLGECPNGGCSRSAVFTVRPSELSDGQHIVTVSAEDGVGHTSALRWSIDVEKVVMPPDASTDSRSEDSTAVVMPPDASTDSRSEDSTGVTDDVEATIDETVGVQPLIIPDDALAPDGPRFDPTKFLDCTTTDEAPNFDSFSLGTSFEGLVLTAQLRRCDAPRFPDPFRANYISYVYGDCDPLEGVGPDYPADQVTPDVGCAPPLEGQSWPVCERNPARYQADLPPDLAAAAAPTERLSVRGVPAAVYDDGQVLEVYAGTTTIAIFGDDLEQMKRAAQLLVQVQLPNAVSLSAALGDDPPPTTDPVGPLIPPMPGGLDNSAPCATTARYLMR